MRITEPRRVLSFISGVPWAIESGKLQEIIDLLNLRISGGELGEDEIQEIVGRRHDHIKPTGGSIAVLPLFGVLAPRMDSMTRFSGGTSLEGFGDSFDEAMANDDIGAIVIHVDSPGGSVQGVEELSTRIFEARGKKRIIAAVDGVIASAAYWVAANADEIVVTPSGLAGAIGVFAMHTEVSKAEAEAGITRTIVKAGKYKAEGNPHEPLSEAAEKHMQGRVDEFYGMFVEAVARARGVDEKRVRNGYGEGAVLTATQALAAGMVDRLGTLEEVLGELGVESSALRGSRAEADDGVDIAATGIHSGILPAPDAPVLSLGDLAVLAEEAREAIVLDMIGKPKTDDADGDASAKESNPPDPTAPSGQEETVKPGDAAAQAGAGDGGVATLTPLEVRAKEDRAVEQDRVDGLIALCKEHNVGNRIEGFLKTGVTAEQAAEILRAETEATLKVLTSPGLELTQAESKRYMITRAIMSVADKGDHWDGFEREVSDQIAKDLPKGYKDHGGIFFPVRRPAVVADRVPVSNVGLMRMRAAVDGDRNLPFATRERLMGQIHDMQAALDAGTATAGKDIVFTEAGDFIDLLRARMKVAQLGATILTGLRGPVAFPKQNAAGTFTWVAEDPGSDVADSDMTFTQVALNPKTGQSSTAYSRQLLNEGVIDVDMLVKNDLALITALGIDLAAINGSGASNQPTGVRQTTGIGDVAIGTDGGAPTYVHMVDLETDVATANADIGSMAYLTTPGVRGKLKKTEEFATSNGRPVWTGGMEGEVNGYPAHVSTQVPSTLAKGTGTNLHAVYFGVWSQLMVGYWGAYELVVDPYRLKKQGVIELTSFQMAGIAVRHPAAFSAIQDADVS